MPRPTCLAAFFALSPLMANAQVTAQPATPQAGPAIASLQISPSERSMRARDTMRLRVRALDAQGKDVDRKSVV